MRKIILIAGATSVVSLAAGFVLGYKLAVNRLEEYYNEQMEVELKKTQAYYERNTKPFADPTEAVKALKPEEAVAVREEAARVATQMEDEEVPIEILQRVVDGLKYNKITPAEPLVMRKKPEVKILEKVVTSVFRGNMISPEEDPNYQATVDNRQFETIYIVSQEEHMENPHEFQTVTLTYYQGDSVLCDEKENPIVPIEPVIGDKDNLQFGRWSGDANVVYIRNETIGVEFEILQSTGKYAVEVAGLDPN